MKRNRKLEPGYKARLQRDRETKKSLKGKGTHAHRYGISPELYLQRMERATICGVCGGRFSDSGPLSKVYDHNHHTMEFRGVIHRHCNVGMGLFNDDPNMLRSAASYLERVNGTHC